MKIAWISKIRDDTIHKTSRIKMIEELNKKGNDADLFMVRSFHDEKKKIKGAYYSKVPNISKLSGFYYGLLIFFYFPMLINKKKYDIIIIDCTKVWMPFVISLKILNIPIILDIRTLPVDREKSFFFKISILIANYLADGISTITKELYDILKKKYHLKVENIEIWSSGVSLSDFENVYEIESTIDVKKNKINFLYHGAYSPTRGIENLIISISKLSKEIKENINLIIIGMPDKKINELNKLSKKYEIYDLIQIYRSVSYDEIRYILSKVDAGIIPLTPKNEWWKVSSPLKTLEYMAASKPIIATDIPFHKKLFSKAKFGVLLNSSSPESIAKGIKELYNKKSELKMLGENGRKLVEKEYSWEQIGAKYEFFLKSNTKLKIDD